MTEQTGDGVRRWRAVAETSVPGGSLEPEPARSTGGGAELGGWASVVRRAGPVDVDTVVDVLARAFDDDPLACYLFGSDRVRRRGLRRFFRTQLGLAMRGVGELWTTDGVRGAALWIPPLARPGAMPLPWRDALRLAPVLMDLVAGGRVVGAMRLLAEIERLRPTVPHWYLATLGTDPPWQGRGVGSSLLADRLAEIDRQGLPAHLESSKERNVPFYARHGFEVTRTVASDDDGVTLWLMWRAPRPVP